MIENSEPRNLAEVLRDEMVFRDKIIALLKQGPRTIPEIAGDLGYPSDEVMFWVMAMWRYNILVETGRPNDEGYYQYQLTQ